MIRCGKMQGRFINGFTPKKKLLGGLLLSAIGLATVLIITRKPKKKKE